MISLSAKWQPCHEGIDSKGSWRKTAYTEQTAVQVTYTTTTEVYLNERLENIIICTAVVWKNTKIFKWVLTCGSDSAKAGPARPGEVLQFGAKRMRWTSVYMYKSNKVCFAYGCMRMLTYTWTVVYFGLKELDASRIRLFWKRAVPSAVQNYAQSCDAFGKSVDPQIEWSWRPSVKIIQFCSKRGQQLIQFSWIIYKVAPPAWFSSRSVVSVQSCQ